MLWPYAHRPVSGECQTHPSGHDTRCPRGGRPGQAMATALWPLSLTVAVYMAWISDA